MKISAKIYSNPNDITMKNSGTKTAGVDYLGEEIGKPIDDKLAELRAKHDYQEVGISDEEQKDDSDRNDSSLNNNEELP